MIAGVGSKKGGQLPSLPHFNCRRCGGQSRCSWSEKLKQWMLICDVCVVACVAPRSLHDEIEHWNEVRQFKLSLRKR